MKLNNKGNSLIELIISIALMSVVLVSMVRLLVDLNNTNTNNDYAKNNQIIRSEILRVIENDLNNNKLSNITDRSTKDNLNFTMEFQDKNATIKATKDKLTYTSSDGNIRTWTMEDASIYTNKAKVKFSKDDNNQIFTLQIDIEIHTQNDNNTVSNNNLLDDILISYYGHISDLKNGFLNTTYVTNDTPYLGCNCN